jgi:hypothetical protein
MAKIAGFSNAVYRSVGKRNSVDESCIQTCRKTNVASQYGLQRQRKYQYIGVLDQKQRSLFFIEIEQTQENCARETIGSWWSWVVIKRAVDQQGIQRVL